jgi:hypothetical protein
MHSEQLWLQAPIHGLHDLKAVQLERYAVFCAPHLLQLASVF